MCKSLTLFLLALSSTYAKGLLSAELLTKDENILNELENKGKIFIDLPTNKPPVNEYTQVNEDYEDSNSINEDLDSNSSEMTQIKIDNGTALILTPYVDNGQIAEAREASKVNSDYFLGVESYSGFFTVNKTYDSNIFFWYFPVENKQVNETPWIIWLQGGPGASSLTGLFDEIGPIRVNQFGTMKRNPYTWVQNHSVLFIDNPVGTGYSFTNHVDGYVSDMNTYSKHLLSTVEQFLQVFPELRTAPLYIAGESYAGKYVPALGTELHNAKTRLNLDVNLKGFIIGNAYIEPSMIRNINRSFYYFGLLNKEQLKSVHPLMEEFRAQIDANNSVAAHANWSKAVSVLLLLSHQQHGYNFLKDKLSVGAYANILKSSEMKKAIHVGDINFEYINVTVNSKMAPDFLSSSKKMFQTLLANDYRVLSYCGQLDQLMSCLHSAKNHRTWLWPGALEFKDSTRYPIMYENSVAGYYKSGGNLTEVVVRGAGHMVPVDKPASAQVLVTNWIQGLPIATPYTLEEQFYLQKLLKNNFTLNSYL